MNLRAALKKVYGHLTSIAGQVKLLREELADLAKRFDGFDAKADAHAIPPGSTLFSDGEIRLFRVSSITAAGVITAKVQTIDAAGDLIDDTDDTDDFTIQVPTSTMIAGSFEGLDSSDAAKYFAMGAGPQTFPIKMSQTGGSAGDKTTQCSFTYTITDWAGNSLGTGVNPTTSPSLYQRPAAGAMVAATVGIAAWVDDGASGVEIAIVIANEVFDVEACS